MKKIRRAVTIVITLLLAFTFVPAAFAHPLGNFTINQYVGLRISRETALVDYVVDMAEIPAFQELAPFDSDRDGQPDSPALQGYPADKCASLLPDLNLTLASRRMDLTLTSSSLELPEGAGGLPTIRLTCEFQSPVDSSQFSSDAVSLSFANNAFEDRLGWKEIVVIPDGVSLEGEFATESVSDRLHSYPQDLLSSPLDQRTAEVEVMFTGLAQSETSLSSTQTVPSSVVVDRNDRFTSLILMAEITLPALLLALGISFIWGAMHAMTPGHGKTIVGAYLVGSRGTMKHALYLGLTTTITHTLGVFALGLVTLLAAQYIVPETLFPWLSLLSGLFVVGIGLNLFWGRLKTSGLGDWLGKMKARRTVLQPAFEMVAVERKHQDHNHHYVVASKHEHSSSNGGGHSHDHAHDHHHDHEHPHDHSHDHGHHHGGDGRGGHSHTPPEEITWRSLLALGVSGGLIPCPSALVVMLGAIALNKIGLGLVLVLAFSLGLAGALTAIGVTFIYAGKLLNKFPSSGKFINVLPVFSALFISLIGLGIVYKALIEMGIV